MCQPVFCYSGYVEEKFSSWSQSMVTWLLGLWGDSTSRRVLTSRWMGGKERGRRGARLPKSPSWAHPSITRLHLTRPHLLTPKNAQG